ncbi:lipopolysaccharide biosynthesis protein [Mesocricetibacter intestinalis]|uniref:lipopolysaccharide biosynthesis protein n=1 Tax=Mesocricetibacter intestinalis TaxID=1521930 RepID=UPI00105C0540|nr:hypothetical protein [Mesocricetibacter intestinalis]
MKKNNLIGLIFITALSTGLTMISAFLLARLLSVDERGALQLFITSVTYGVTVGAGGVGFALALGMRNRQYLHWKKYVAGFLAYTVLVGCIALYLFNITSFSLLFVLNVLLTAVLNITLEKSKIDHRLKIYRVLTLQQPILAVLLYGGCYLLFGERQLSTVLWLLTGLTAIQAALCCLYLYRIEREFLSDNQVTPIESKFFFRHWAKQNLLQVFGATTSNLDKFLIVYFLGNYTLGLYTVCMAFDALLTRFINVLADYYYSGLLNRLNRIKAVLAVILLMSVAAVALVPFLAEPVVAFFFSHKYTAVAPLLLWFVINSILAGLSWVLSQNMLICGKQVLLFSRQLVSILVFVVLFYWLRDLQLQGVAYALIGASLTRLIISIVYYFKFPLDYSSSQQGQS